MLGVVGVEVSWAERRDEGLVGGACGIGQCRPHPEHEIRVASVVGRAGREPPHRLAEDTLDPLVGASHPPRSCQRLGPVTERHGVHGCQRAAQPPEGVASVVRVVRHPGRHERMSHLQQQRAASAEQHRSLPAHAPEPAPFGKESRRARRKPGGKHALE